jgi:predicted CXXCH cytochrome family protein
MKKPDLVVEGFFTQLGIFARRARRVPLLRFLGVFCVLSAHPAFAEPKKHPSLVDPAAARCLTCHGRLLSQPVKHVAAVDDCLACHSFVKKDGQTLVSFSSAQPELCVGCHSDQAAAAAGKVAAPHAPVTGDCTTCHNPHSSDVPKLLRKRLHLLCDDCHGADDLRKGHPYWVATAACLSCHAPHGSSARGLIQPRKQHPPFEERSCDACHFKGLKGRKAKRKPADVCFACHSDRQKAFSTGFVHGAVAQGNCTGCHDPHLSTEPKLIKSKSPGLCLPCHAGIARKLDATSVHAPAKEDCSSCHEPHRSDHPKLLNTPAPVLCLTCHDEKDAKLAEKHLGAAMGALVCGNCHDPHGSTQKHLILTGSFHPPFAEGSCEACHAGKSAKKFNENGTRALCAACHDVAEGAAKAAHPHAALDSAECVDCHTPHASLQERLVKAPGGEVCVGCHGDQVPEKDEVAHGVIARFGCQACHLPHGGERQGFLRAAGNDLCLGCHDPARAKTAEGSTDLLLLDRFRVSRKELDAIATLRLTPDGLRNHPVSNHRVIGAPTAEEIEGRHIKSSFQGELGCSSCHDPHKGKSHLLLRDGARAALENCQKCHSK